MFDHLIFLFEQQAVLFLGTLFVLGSLIGSFLNVVIYRLPVMMQREWRHDCLEFLEQANDAEVEKFNLIDRMLEATKAQNDGSYEVNEIDGIRVTTEDGWWLLRASNTQNVLVTRAEASSENGLEKLKDMVYKAVKEVGYEVCFDS